MATTLPALLDEWLAARLGGPQRAWLDEKLRGAAERGADAGFSLAFGTAPRKVGRADLRPTVDELREVARVRPGLEPTTWTVDQTVRARLLLALPSENAAEFGAALDRLSMDAELGELVALHQALPLLPHPTTHRTRTAEGIRTNMKPAFEAIALRNPYPAEQLDESAWNQLVLKCLFVGSPLRLVRGIDARVNETLARMLSDYAHERWAAGRKVSPELWRPVGPVASGAGLSDLERVLATGTDVERAAVALASADNPRLGPLLSAHRAAVDRAIAAFPSWDAIAAAS
jgi:hypothetical protein